MILHRKDRNLFQAVKDRFVTEGIVCSEYSSDLVKWAERAATAWVRTGRFTHIEDVTRVRRFKAPPLSITHPEVACGWLYSRNCGYGPEDFPASSRVLVWWQCSSSKDHVFIQPIKIHVEAFNRSTQGCPFCKGLRPSKINNLAEFYPELAAEWVTKKNGIPASRVVNYSGFDAWWRCKTCKFEWKATIDNRTSNESGCPRCNKGETTDLRDYPKALRQFDREKNPDVDPYHLTQKEVVWWRCHRGSDHVWKASFTRSATERCPFCRGHKGSSTNNLGMFPELVGLLHPTKNGDLDPHDIPIGSCKKVWWKCSEGPDHEWQSRVEVKTKLRTGCPFCKNQFVSVTNSLASLFPAIAAEWHKKKNGDLSPLDVVAATGKKVWWCCSKGHEFEMSGYERTKFGRGCGVCRGRVSGPPRKLDEDQFKLAIKLLSKGKSVHDVAGTFGVHVTTLRRYLKEKQT